MANENFSTSAIFKPNMQPFFCSWSGGKDSALAFYKSIQNGYPANCLLTMMTENGLRSRSHGISKNVLEEQAQCLDLTIHFCATSWNQYTENFLEKLKFFKENGIEIGVFGDIDIESHLQWVQDTCLAEKINTYLPLWNAKRLELLQELLTLGFQAEIVAIKKDILSPMYLGKILNEEILAAFTDLGIDLCGETGEYHTLATNGPIFKKPLIVKHGKQVLRDGYWFSDVLLIEKC